MKITVELFIDDPISNDIDELTDAVTDAVEAAVGDADYVVSDIGLSFELIDAY